MLAITVNNSLLKKTKHYGILTPKEAIAMTQEQYLKNLTVPEGPVDVILDTDAYNETDDQFAIAYLLSKGQKLNLKGICAAPFLNRKVESPLQGMEQSYVEILNLLRLMGKENVSNMVYRGSGAFLPDEKTPVSSAAADLMAQLAENYSPEKPLYIVAIGAITNVASAFLQNPRMADNCVVVWLGGHGIHMPDPGAEFNMRQDIAAARVVFDSGVPLALLPCRGVVDRFCTSKYELAYWLKGKNALCDYLYAHATAVAEEYASGRPWTRTIWDVTAVAWLLNEEECFMRHKLISCPVPRYDRQYGFYENRRPIRYVFWIDRDALFEDLFNTLGGMV